MVFTIFAFLLLFLFVANPDKRPAGKGRLDKEQAEKYQLEFHQGLFFVGLPSKGTLIAPAPRRHAMVPTI